MPTETNPSRPIDLRLQPPVLREFTAEELSTEEGQLAADAEVQKAGAWIDGAMDAIVDYADRHRGSFGFYPAYGMGGTYYSSDYGSRPESTDNWAPSTDSGWRSSSMGC